MAGKRKSPGPPRPRALKHSESILHTPPRNNLYVGVCDVGPILLHTATTYIGGGRIPLGRQSPQTHRAQRHPTTHHPEDMKDIKRKRRLPPLM